jgi:hypothetical protein
MARTIDYWYKLIMAQKNSDTTLTSAVTSTSQTANFNLWAYIFAVAMTAIDNLFDLHKSDVDTVIATKKPHGLQWYRDLALRFQYGQEPVADSDTYTNTGLTDEQITAQQIIAQAAVTELNGNLRVKVVKLVNEDYAQLTDDEQQAFTAFLFLQKDAGVKIVVDSLQPDSLKCEIDVFYNALVLRNDGSRIDGTATTPVPDAINSYLKTLKFNGEYADNRLQDAIGRGVYPGCWLFTNS